MIATADAEPTLRTLLKRADLGLTLLGAEDARRAEALDRPVRWVHSTDLSDPTPFLADDLVLLTTGTQFDPDAEDSVIDEYVSRLARRGVLGLGFGTAVVRPAMPARLPDACAAVGLPLFEVPYRTPFIAVARANAEAVAAQSYARRSWALAAQRALALAALRPDGLARTVAELGRQLDTWVGLYDAGGVLRLENTDRELTPESADAVRQEVEAVLRRGSRAASAIGIEGTDFTLQTLGRGGRLRGVLAIASGELDQEGRGVITSVVALAGLALEQQQGLQRARGRLRAGLVELALAGSLPLVRAVGRDVGIALPAAPVRVARVAESGTSLVISEALEIASAVFFGRSGDDLLLICGADSTVPDEIAVRFAVRVGLSDPVTHADLAAGAAQAAAVLRGGAPGVVRFSGKRAQGVLANASEDARTVAAAILAPLRAHDAAERSALASTLRAFLEHDGSHEATARALGVHRHTIRARVRAAEQVLGTDLGGFPARAELWAAFLATD
ncbi:PucR family transcriptional regulator [Microbacterium gorillae]|uniref:PucR family transcriptional regulator n=1 Tax=Microbacterium gorillae TaxID=1231063 RepID=UPI00058EDF55|nr:PucR family transcriptional regulator [Microbacterium gorillae]